MKARYLPHPLMSLVLTVVWLLLVNGFSVAQLLLGAVLGVLIPYYTSDFWPERPRLRRPGLALRYLLRLLFDILVANFQVARLVLGPTRRLRPAFLRLPLELEDDFAIAVLASTITLTPGTVSADLSPDRRELLVHCLDSPDPQALARRLKARYEGLIGEMLGGVAHELP